jgi:hypothetical protein
VGCRALDDINKVNNTRAPSEVQSDLRFAIVLLRTNGLEDLDRNSLGIIIVPARRENI